MDVRPHRTETLVRYKSDQRARLGNGFAMVLARHGTERSTTGYFHIGKVFTAFTRLQPDNSLSDIVLTLFIGFSPCTSLRTKAFTRGKKILDR